jgi:hypothetical protein
VDRGSRTKLFLRKKEREKRMKTAVAINSIEPNRRLLKISHNITRNIAYTSFELVYSAKNLNLFCIL